MGPPNSSELIYDERNFYSKPSDESGPGGSGSRKGDGGGIRDSAADAEARAGEGARGRLAALKARAASEVTESDLELFAVGRGSGTGELTGQRILQVATILRNLSFEEDNVAVLGKADATVSFGILSFYFVGIELH